MAAILNKILRDQLDPDVVMKKLHETQQGVEEIRKQEDFSGLLTPGNDPTPPNPCGERVPEGATIILLGNSASFATKSPDTIIEINGDPMLIMEHTEGRIAISAKLFSNDGRIVAELKRNQFFINPNNYFRKEISIDGHSLSVYDQNDFKVLDVTFLNPKTVSFLGIIRHPLGGVEISKTRGMFSNTMCSAENGRAEYGFDFSTLPATH